MNSILEARVYREAERLRRKEKGYTKQIRTIRDGWLVTIEAPAYTRGYDTREHNYTLYRNEDGGLRIKKLTLSKLYASPAYCN